jgi:hypothetical protein
MRVYRVLKNSVPDASGAKGQPEKTGFIAALKALRYPKASFSAHCFADICGPTSEVEVPK